MKVIVFFVLALAGMAGIFRIVERSIQTESAPSPAMLWADDLVTAKLKREGFTHVRMLGDVNWAAEGQHAFEAVAKDGRKVRGYVTSNHEPLGVRVHVMQWGIE